MGGVPTRRREYVCSGFRSVADSISAHLIVLTLLAWASFLTGFAADTSWIDRAKSNPRVWNYASGICGRLGLSSTSYDHSGHRNRIPLQKQCLNKQVNALLTEIESDLSVIRNRYLQARRDFNLFLSQPDPDLRQKIVVLISEIHQGSRRLRKQIEAVSRVRIDEGILEKIELDERSVTQRIAYLAVQIFQTEERVISFLTDPQVIRADQLCTFQALESVLRLEIMSTDLATRFADERVLEKFR